MKCVLTGGKGSIFGFVCLIGLLTYPSGSAHAMLSRSISAVMEAAKMDSSDPCKENHPGDADDSIERHLDFLLSKGNEMNGATVCIDFDGTIARRQEIIPDQDGFEQYEKFATAIQSCVAENSTEYSKEFSNFYSNSSYDEFNSPKNRKEISTAIKAQEVFYPLFLRESDRRQVKENQYRPMGNTLQIRDKIQTLKKRGALVLICTKGSNCPFESQEAEPVEQMKIMREFGIEPTTNCIVTGDTKSKTNISNGFSKKGLPAPDHEKLYLIDNDEKQLEKFQPDFSRHEELGKTKALLVRNKLDTFLNTMPSEIIDPKNLFASLWLFYKDRMKPIEKRKFRDFFTVVDSCMVRTNPKWMQDYKDAQVIVDSTGSDHSKVRRKYLSDALVKRVAANPGFGQKLRAEALMLSAKSNLDFCKEDEIPTARMISASASAAYASVLAQEDEERADAAYREKYGHQPEELLARRFRMRFPEGGSKEQAQAKALLDWKNTNEMRIILDEAKKAIHGMGELNRKSRKIDYSLALIDDYLKSPRPGPIALKVALEIATSDKNLSSLLPKPYWEVDLKEVDLEAYLEKAALAGNAVAVHYLLGYGLDPKGLAKNLAIPEEVRVVLQKQMVLRTAYKARLGAQPERLGSEPNAKLEEAFRTNGQKILLANKFGAIKECTVNHKNELTCDGESAVLTLRDAAAYSGFRLVKN